MGVPDRVSFDIRLMSSPAFAVAALALLAMLQWGCPHYGSVPASRQQGQNLGQQNPVAGANRVAKQSGDTVNSAEAFDAEARQPAETGILEHPRATSDVAKTLDPGTSRGRQLASVPPRTSDGGKEPDLSSRLEWPVKGKIVSGFRVREGTQFNGISIEAPEGSQVRAAAVGTVGHVGFIAGYGNVVLVDHPNRLVTVYGHLKEITVRKGEAVKKGAAIAKVAGSNQTENSTVYFAVRAYGKPRNPISFLSP